MRTFQVPNCISVPKETPWDAGTLYGKLRLSKTSQE